VTESEPAVRRVIVNLCELCIAGAGGECHVPGCVLWINRAPDLPLHPELMEDATIDELGLDSLRAVFDAACAWRDETDDDSTLLPHDKTLIRAVDAARKAKPPGSEEG
jgi:hypothetical protein